MAIFDNEKFTQGRERIRDPIDFGVVVGIHKAADNGLCDSQAAGEFNVRDALPLHRDQQTQLGRDQGRDRYP